MRRWRGVFDDLEAQLEHELATEEAAVRLEEERFRIGRLVLRDRLRSLADAGPDPVRLVLQGGEHVSLRELAVGRDWVAGDLDPGAGRSAVIPIAAIDSVLVVPDRIADEMSPPPGRTADLASRLGLVFVLRDLGRRRAPLDLIVGAEGVHGTIDRVGRDHLDLAEHDAGEPRRADRVRRIRIVPFDALRIVRF